SCFAQGDNFIERSAVNKSRAAIARQQGRDDESIAFARKAYDLAREGGDSVRMADAEQEIAFAHQELGDYTTAAEYFKRGAEFFRRNNDLYFATISLLNYATSIEDLGREAEAIQACEEALRFSVDNNFASLELDVRNVLGNLFWSQEQYERAEEQFLYAYDLSVSQERDRLGAEFLSYLTGVQLHLNKYAAAKRHGKKALELSEQQGQIALSHRTYGHLATIASREGNFKNAYDYMVLRQGFQDSLNDQNLNDKLAELTLLFEKEKQDRLIADQQNQLALLEAQTQFDQLQKRSLWYGLLAAIGFFGAIAYSLWQRNRRQRLEKAQLAAKVTGQQRELSAHALQMAQKSQLLDQLSEELRQIKGERPDDRKKLDGVLRELSSEERIDQDWANFRAYFQGVHGDFEERLKTKATQKLTPRELRLAALIKMQLNNQEVGAIMSVSQDSLYKAKYRLRKKLPDAGEGDLDGYLREL
ncbi:MAG: tetratricopeptide repeat protein, partial [Bacteroidota bacterium]